MRKHEEARFTHGCWHRAENNEMLFVLLARDPAAPVAVRAWMAERVRLGLNTPDDRQYTEAYFCSEWMELQRQFPDVYMPLWAAEKRTRLENELKERAR